MVIIAIQKIKPVLEISKWKAEDSVKVNLSNHNPPATYLQTTNSKASEAGNERPVIQQPETR